jgi:hypothetical protein
MQQQESILPDLPMYGEGELFPDWAEWLQRFNTVAGENKLAIAKDIKKKKAKLTKKVNPFQKVKNQKKTSFSRSHKKKKQPIIQNAMDAFISQMTVMPVIVVPPPVVQPAQESCMGISFSEMAADWYSNDKGIVLVFGDRSVHSMCCGSTVGSFKLSQHSFYSSSNFKLALPKRLF